MIALVFVDLVEAAVADGTKYSKLTEFYFKQQYPRGGWIKEGTSQISVLIFSYLALKRRGQPNLVCLKRRQTRCRLS